jgi:hypothetical protein
MEENPEEMKSVAEHQEVPKEEAAIEMIGALKDRSVDRRLAVRRCGQLIGLAVPARRKVRSHKGPTVEKRR